MATSSENYRGHAGYVLFPRSTDDLTDTTQCPACQVPVAAAVCANCGLDLSNSLGSHLVQASIDAATALERRLDLIGRIRCASASVAHSRPSNDATPPAASSATMFPKPALRRQKISVQLVLLLVGIALLSVGAIFFLVYAFIGFGLVWRSLTITTATVFAYLGATLLRRHRLTATAESVAVLAVVLTYLDVFALRANDLLVIGDSDGFTHWGIALLISAAVFILWNRLSGLRMASFVGFVAIGPGLALLVLGLTDGVPHAVAHYLALLALAIGCLAHPLTNRISRQAQPGLAERYTVMVLALGALIGGGVVATDLARDLPFAPTVSLLAVAAIAVAHTVLTIRVHAPVMFASAFAAVGGAAAAASFGFAGSVNADPSYSIIIPLIAATIVALLVEAFYRRQHSSFLLTPLVVAAFAAGAVAVLSALSPLMSALVLVLDAVAPAARPGSLAGTAAIVVESENVLAIIALAVAVGLVTAAWAVQDLLRQRFPVVLWAGAVVLVLAVPLTSVRWLIVSSGMMVALGLAVALIGSLHRTNSRRLPIAAGGLAALLLGYATSWVSADTWLLGGFGALAVLVVSRWAVAHPAPRATILSVAAIVALVTAGAGGWRTQQLSANPASAPLLAHLAVAAVGVVLLLIAAATRRLLCTAETRVLLWIGLSSALVTVPTLWIRSTMIDPTLVDTLVVPAYTALVVVSGALLVMLLAWVRTAVAGTLRAERRVAAIALAPAAAFFALSLSSVVPGEPSVGMLEVIAVASSALVSASVLVSVSFGATTKLRSAVDIGAVSVAAVAALIAVIAAWSLGWLVLALAAVIALVTSVAPDGLFASNSSRKYWGWQSLTLGIAALVWLLDTEAVAHVAAFVLPPAGALLLIAAAAWWSARRRAVSSGGAPWIALAGLVLGLVPLGLVHSAQPSPWLILIAAVSATLLLAGTLGQPSSVSRPYRNSAALAGGLGLIGSAYAHTYVIALRGTGDNELVVWMAAVFVVFSAAAVGTAASGITELLDDRPLRPVLSQVLLGVPMVATLVVGGIAVGNGPRSLPGGVTLVVVFCLVHVISSIVNRAPFTRLVGWVALSFAVVAAILSSTVGRLQPLEWATVPIAIALLVTGGLQLGRDPRSRSWGWLSPGVLALILPSLVASFIDGPVWRLVGIGVACAAAVVAGAVLRLQAPLVLGAVLVLLHALRTFAPQLVAVYQLTEWWVWAVVAGAIVFFLGMTFDKRRRDFQSTATKIAALR